MAAMTAPRIPIFTAQPTPPGRSLVPVAMAGALVLGGVWFIGGGLARSLLDGTGFWRMLQSWVGFGYVSTSAFGLWFVLHRRGCYRSDRNGQARGMAKFAAFTSDPIVEFDRNGLPVAANRAAFLVAARLARPNEGMLPPATPAKVRESLDRREGSSGVFVGPDGASWSWRIIPSDDTATAFIHATSGHDPDAGFAQVRAAAHSESASRLAVGIAHDLVNHLLAIHLHVGLLSLNHSADECRESSETLNVEISRAQWLARKLMATAGPVESWGSSARSDCTEAVAAVAETMCLIKRRDLQLMVGGSGRPLPVRADPRELELAILHLAMNAVDAMPSGGCLTIGAHSTYDGYAAIVIADTGAGLSATPRDLPFAAFYTTRRDGTGLGLTWVRSFAHRCGGEVAFESSVGEGTLFQLRIPLAG